MRLFAFGVVAIGALSVAAYEAYDRAANFGRVEARVVSVQTRCYMEKREGRTTSTSDVIDCALAEYAVASHPKWSGYDIRRKITIAFIFTSPADGRVHQAQRDYDRVPGSRGALRSGDTFEILASKKHAEKTRDV